MPVYIAIELPTEEESEQQTHDKVFAFTQSAVEGVMRAKGLVVSEHDASIARTAAVIALAFVPTAFHMDNKSWNVKRGNPKHTPGTDVFIVIPEDDEEENSDAQA